MDAMKPVLYLGLFATVFVAGCGTAAQSDSSNSLKLPPGKHFQVVRQGAIPFHDVPMKIQKEVKNAVGGREFWAMGTEGGRPVGFRFGVGPKWEKKKVDPRVNLDSFWGYAAIRSIGKESDALVQELVKAWKVSSRADRMKPEMKLGAIAIEGDPTKFEAGLVRIKLFWEGANEEDYTEFYINVDLPKKQLSLLEKATDYRPQMIRAFAK
jgi:hypothetical protein